MIFRNGKGAIHELTITPNSSRTPIDISQIVTRISFYEDLFTPYITCNIDIVDGISLREILPITGGERIRINVGEESDSKDVRDLEADMVVFRMSGKQRNNVDAEFYTINLITPENLMDTSMSVTTSFHKPISDIVNDVVTTKLTPITGKRLIDVEQTKGIHRMVATGISPTSFIRQCSREAESQDNPSSIYMFFETVEGYHFVTLDYLYKKEPIHHFTYDISPHSEDSQAMTKRQYYVNHIQFDNSFDLLGGQMAGQFNTQTFHFDPLSKSFRRSDYVYGRDFNQSKFVNKTVNQNVIDAHFQSPSATRFLITDSHRRDIDYIIDNDPEADQTFRRRQDFMDRERSVLMQYSGIRITASLPGNAAIKVGDTLNLIIPSPSVAEDEKILNDKLYSGKYVVSAVAHNIVSSGDYATVIELIRPGFEDKM